MAVVVVQSLVSHLEDFVDTTALVEECSANLEGNICNLPEDSGPFVDSAVELIKQAMKGSWSRN